MTRLDNIFRVTLPGAVILACMIPDKALAAGSVGDGTPIWMMVLGLTGLLALAVVMFPVANRLRFPYTVMLALVGGVLGLLRVLLEGSELPMVRDFLTALDSFSISSEMVFFVFLPVLVFESALSIDVRRLMEDIGPILFLAVIGLIISTAAVGFVMQGITPYGLVLCLLLGAIVSATDPVAVVAYSRIWVRRNGWRFWLREKARSTMQRRLSPLPCSQEW